MIMIYIFFDVLDNVGIDASEVIQITTVFSLGLSWSMRDWLSRCVRCLCRSDRARSLWASFMIAFTTELSCGSVIQAGFSGKSDELLTVVRPGLIYTMCTSAKKTDRYKPEDDSQCKFVYVPNSVLLSGGFVIKSKKV